MTLVVGGTLSGLFLGRVDADAKVVSYQINGQTYTYDTLDRQQVRIARERINAAKTADEARARASAEASANPLVRILGSQAQTEATRADAELKRTLSTNGYGVAVLMGDGSPTRNRYVQSDGVEGKLRTTVTEQARVSGLAGVSNKPAHVVARQEPETTSQPAGGAAENPMTVSPEGSWLITSPSGEPGSTGSTVPGKRHGSATEDLTGFVELIRMEVEVDAQPIQQNAIVRAPAASNWKGFVREFSSASANC
jgi:hypothetical protein